jgi:hypothetical protein
MTFADLVKTWSTKDVCEQLERLNELPTPLPPEIEAQREAVQTEWARRPADDQAKARMEVRTSQV